MNAFELALFFTKPDFAQQAVQAGITNLVIDWESKGKEQRQESFDTQINYHTLEDLSAARAVENANIICRINGMHDGTQAEIDTAAACGADEILVPMVASVAEVEQIIGLAGGRCKVGVMIETVAATQIVAQLDQLGLSRMFVGLNDLWIERKTRHIFDAIADGTVEQVRRQVQNTAFGFGGLTLPDKGHPLPCQLLIDELVRLDADYTFLRRSFLRDIQGRDLNVEVPRILAAMAQSHQRSGAEMAQDNAELIAAIRRLPAGSWRI